MADYELIGLNEAAPDLRAPTAADRGIIAGGVRVVGLAELDGGADINGDPVATVSRTNPLRQAVRVAMTAAASGSNGIQVLDNANVNTATNNFTLHWEGALPDWTPAAIAYLQYKISSNIGFIFSVETTGHLRVRINATNYLSTVVTGLIDGSAAKISAVVTRESASVAGSIVFYVNGVQLGASVAITAGSPATTTQAIGLYFDGDISTRSVGDFGQAIIYNRALSAAEVLSLSVNGPALADIGASQLLSYTSNFSAGVDGWTGASGTTITGNNDSIAGEDDWLRLQVASAIEVRAFSSSVFTVGRNISIDAIKIHNPNAFTTYVGLFTTRTLTTGSGNASDAFVTLLAGETKTLSLGALPTAGGSVNVAVTNSSGNLAAISSAGSIYIKGVVASSRGITGQWNAENAQSNTGQILDTSGNGNHALLPAAGATIIGRPTAQPQQVRWTNTWAGTNELQYIGGVNQAILPAKAYIESIVGVITGATVEDIIIGDGSDTDRYVTLTTGLAAGTVTFTLANRTTDGTNLKLTVDPDANATMSIAWTIVFRTLE